MEEKKSVMAHPKVVPDPEVPEKTVRRKFTAAYKLRILKEAESRTEWVRSELFCAGKVSIRRASPRGGIRLPRALFPRREDLSHKRLIPASAVLQCWNGRTKSSRINSSRQNSLSTSKKKWPSCSRDQARRSHEHHRVACPRSGYPPGLQRP